MTRTLISIFAFAVCLISSCSKIDTQASPAKDGWPSVASFPSYDSDIKSIGTAEAGKTAWEKGDTVYLYASKDNAMASSDFFKMVYDGSKWALADASKWAGYASGDVYFDAIYAPGYTSTKAGTLSLKRTKVDGQDEFLRKKGQWTGSQRNVTFSRDYSRIRVATTKDFKAVLSCSSFIPVGLEPKPLADSSITTVANSNGNAFFYGKMSESKRIVITVYEGNAAKNTCFLDGKTLKDGKSYVVSPAANSKPIKILAIGNSFSADAVEQELYGLFEAIGQPVVIGDAYIGGCPLDKHAANATANNAAYSYRKTSTGTWTKTADQTLEFILKNEQWDYVSLQEGAGYHGFYNATYKGTTHSMEPHLTTLINYVKEKCPGAKLIYHAPWVAKADYTGTKFSYYGFSQDVMYDMIVEASAQVLQAHPEFSMYINTVDAIQNLRSSFIGDNVTRDGWHLSYTVGRYTAGCIWFEKIMGRSVEGNSYKCPQISDYKAKVCQAAAHQACLHPNTVTDLSYFEPEPVEPEPAKTVLAKWRFTPDNAKNDGYIKTWCNQTALGVYTYGNEPGETGYILANDGGSGKLSHVQTDKTQWTSSKEVGGRCIFNVSNGGQPVICGTVAGDYWLFETTGDYDLPEGSRIHVIYTITPGKYGQKYWMVEYRDGTQWKPAFEVKTTDIATSGEKGVKYNLSLTASNFSIVEFTVTLDEPSTDFAFRMTASSEYQVNDVWFNHPRTASEYRIAGDPGNAEAKPSPEIDLMLE